MAEPKQEVTPTDVAGLTELLRQRTAELERTRLRLKEKNDEVQMFVYTVSHDLRSPLVNLQGFCQELNTSLEELRELVFSATDHQETRERLTDLIENDLGESVRFIRSSAERLGTQIDAMLRVSRAGRASEHPERVPLRAHVDRVVATLREEITSSGVEVSVGELPDVWADPIGVDLILGHLIRNAVMYVSPDRPGRVEVGATAIDERGAATLYVRDNGLGIAPEHHQRVFQIFQRIHSVATLGEGIGLTIVQRVVDRLGGKVWVESEPNKGSTFFVRLPGEAEVPAGGEDRQ